MTAVTVPLRDVCTFRHGGTPSKSNPEFWGGDIPWVSPKDMKTTLLMSSEDSITEKGVNGSATSLVPEGSILTVVRSGILAHSVPFAVAGRPLTFNQDIKAIQVTGDRFTSNYVYWFLRSKEPEILSRGVKKGATVHSLQSGFLERLEIPVLSKPEQLRIVDLLARAENIVRLRREAEQKAREVIPALFLDMFGDPGTNSKGWAARTIHECCVLVRGSSPRPQGDSRFFGGPVPRLMIADITRDGTYVTPAIDSLTVEGAERSRPMESGDVVMAVSGAVGLPAILAVDACIHDGFVGFRALTPDLRAEYLYTYLSLMRAVTEKQAVGATFQNLKTDQIREWRIPLPPVALQDVFVERCRSARTLLQCQARASAGAISTFQSLLAGVFGESGTTCPMQ